MRVISTGSTKGINRNIVECKVVRNEKKAEDFSRINRNIVECKDAFC